MSPSANNSGGCLILFNKASLGEIVTLKHDNVGRYVILLTTREDLFSLTACIHAPNSHYLLYFKTLYDEIESMLEF